jgi:hypothetical protein
MPDTRSFRDRRAPKDGRITNTSGGIRSVTFARWAIASSMFGGMAIADSNRRSISLPTTYQSVAPRLKSSGHLVVLVTAIGARR